MLGHIEDSMADTQSALLFEQDGKLTIILAKTPEDQPVPTGVYLAGMCAFMLANEAAFKHVEEAFMRERIRHMTKTEEELDDEEAGWD